MLTLLSPTELPAPVSARAVASIHPLPDLGFGSPTGVSASADRGTAGTAAPVESHESWMRDRLILAERTGGILKITGSRSISSPGGEA